MIILHLKEHSYCTFKIKLMFLMKLFSTFYYFMFQKYITEEQTYISKTPVTAVKQDKVLSVSVSVFYHHTDSW